MNKEITDLRGRVSFRVPFNIEQKIHVTARAENRTVSEVLRERIVSSFVYLGSEVQTVQKTGE